MADQFDGAPLRSPFYREQIRLPELLDDHDEHVDFDPWNIVTGSIRLDRSPHLIRCDLSTEVDLDDRGRDHDHGEDDNHRPGNHHYKAAPRSDHHLAQTFGGYDHPPVTLSD